MPKVVLVGGAGFVGSSLAHALKDAGHTVCVYDLAEAHHTLLDSVALYVKGDVLDLDKLVSTFERFSPDCIIHLASWGMSGSPMLSPQCTRINLGGVDCLLEAMRQTERECLIYTSTYNVVYGGEEIIDGDESLPYYPLERHTDAYSRSKAEAEQLVLASNGIDNMRTMSLRPAAIYGDGEERHLPRIIKHIDSGLFQFRIGKESIVDWVHIDNLVASFLCAVDKLTDEYNPRKAPCGRSYFISDGTPIDNFEFLRPLVVARGRHFPAIVLPVWLALHLAALFELLFHLFGIEPFLTRAEVLKVGRSHYFTIESAREELGYHPSISSEEGAGMLGMNHSKIRSSEHYLQLAPLSVYLLVNLAMLALYTVAFHQVDSPLYVSSVVSSVTSFLSFSSHLGFLNSVAAPAATAAATILTTLIGVINTIGLAIFRTQRNLQYTFVLAVTLHLLEALYTCYLCVIVLQIRADLTAVWVVQTALLGYGSLRYLLERVDRQVK